MSLHDAVSWAIINTIAQNPGYMWHTVGVDLYKYEGIVSEYEEEVVLESGGVTFKPRWTFITSNKKDDGTGSLTNRFTAGNPQEGDVVGIQVQGLPVDVRVERITRDSGTLNAVWQFDLVSPDTDG